jgi:hypothetical protein
MFIVLDVKMEDKEQFITGSTKTNRALRKKMNMVLMYDNMDDPMMMI